MLRWFEVLPDPERSAACVLRVGDEIGLDQTAEDCVKALEGFSEVTLAVDSSGGDARTAFAVASTLLGRCPRAVISGRCFSAAGVLMLAAEHRTATKSSTFLVHRASAAAYGNEEELAAALNYLRGFNPILADWLHGRTGAPTAVIADWLSGPDRYFGVDEAKSAGLIHEVIPDPVREASKANPKAGTVPATQDDSETLLALLRALGPVRCADPARVRREVGAWLAVNLR